MQATYQHVVFAQGDDANEPLDILYNPVDGSTVHYSGPTAESVAAAVAYLAQWDMGEGEPAEAPKGDANHDVIEHGGYVITASLSYGWVGMVRAATPHVEYPHEPGRLYDCPACEQHCFCGDLATTTPCVHCAESTS